MNSYSKELETRCLWDTKARLLNNPTSVMLRPIDVAMDARNGQMTMHWPYMLSKDANNMVPKGGRNANRTMWGIYDKPVI